MQFRQVILFFALLTSCQGTDHQDKRTDQQKPFLVEVKQPDFNLVQSNLSIESIKGSFVGCNEEAWEIKGSKGQVFAGLDCQSVAYESISFRDGPAGALVTLAFNSGDTYQDALGISWKFASDPDSGAAVLSSQFNADLEEGITINNNRFTIELAIDNHADAFCDYKKPFSITSQSDSTVRIKLNTLASQDLNAIEFVVEDSQLADGHPVPEIVNVGFDIDFSSAAPATYTYENVMMAKKGDSSCKITKLTVNLETSDETPLPKQEFDPARLKTVSTLDAGQTMSLAIYKDHAYLGNHDNVGIYVYDIKDPRQPKLTKKLDNATNSHGLVIYNNKLFTASRGGPGKIYDLSNPSNPQLISEVPQTASSVVVSNDYVFYTFGQAIHVYDVKVTSSPQLVNTIPSCGFFSMKIKGNYLYALCGKELEIIDISDPRNGQTVSRSFLAATSRDIEIKGDFAYIASYDLNNDVPFTTIIDISNPVDPLPVFFERDVKAFSVDVTDEYYFSFGDKVKVWDIKEDPAKPKLIQTAEFAMAASFCGIFYNQHLFVCDVSKGVHVIGTPQ